jgi:hypothetical protein
MPMSEKVKCPPPRGPQDMSDSEKPKRKFWQIHLSTAVLLTLVSGALIQINCRDRLLQLSNGSNIVKNFDDDKVLLLMIGVRKQYGWPFIAVEYIHNGTDDLTIGIACPEGLSIDLKADNDLKLKLTHAPFVYDFLVGLAVLISCGLSFEWLIRRREGRKP